MYGCQQKCKYLKNITEPPHFGMDGHIESRLTKNQCKQRKGFGRPVLSPDFNPFNYFFCVFTKYRTYYKDKFQIKE
jgi:hypothetical protein